VHESLQTPGRILDAVAMRRDSNASKSKQIQNRKDGRVASVRRAPACHADKVSGSLYGFNLKKRLAFEFGLPTLSELMR
jgi:hypothetical protein